MQFKLFETSQNKERFLLQAKFLIVKLRFGLPFKHFPQHKALWSFRRFPKQRVCSLGQNPKALVWKWRKIFSFKIDIPTVNAPALANKVLIFKLIIEDYFNKHSELIGSKFLPLAATKSVAFFLGHPVCNFNFELFERPITHDSTYELKLVT